MKVIALCALFALASCYEALPIADAGADTTEAPDDVAAPADVAVDAAPALVPVVEDGGRCVEPEGENGIYTLECGDLPCRTCHLIPSSRPLVGCTVAAANDLCVLACSDCPP